VVIDAGTGPGALARGLRRGSGASGPARQVVGVDHGDALPDVAGAVIIANELLDNVPFRMIERSGDGWLEVWVDDRGAAGVEEVLRPLDADAVGLVPPSCADLAPGTRLPLLEQAAGWMGDVLARGPAAVLMFDYGALTTVELARRGGWLRTYRHHQRGHDPYREAGQWDITTDIAVDQLPGRPETTDQATFLHRWGIDDLVAQGRRYWTEHAGRPDVTAIRMRSRVAEAEALLDPDGLGGWLTCLWRP
jgi:SAM-dependent MidA family methyltransferase